MVDYEQGVVSIWRTLFPRVGLVPVLTSMTMVVDDKG